MNTAMLIDAEFLRQEASNTLNIERCGSNVHYLTQWLRKDGINHIRWYDAIYRDGAANANKQRHWLDSMADQAQMKLRLGTLVERDSSLYERAMYRMLSGVAADLNVDPDALTRAVGAHWESRSYRQQKGVDALLILDMLQLAMSGNINVICLCAGDTDFLPVIHEVQQRGIPVNMVVPRPQRLSPQIKREVDAAVAIPIDVLRQTFGEGA